MDLRWAVDVARQSMPGQVLVWSGARNRTSKAHPARIYDYLLGGKDHFEADRETSAGMLMSGQPGRQDAPGEPGLPRPGGALPGRGGGHPAVPRHRLGLAAYLVPAGFPSWRGLRRMFHVGLDSFPGRQVITPTASASAVRDRPVSRCICRYFGFPVSCRSFRSSAANA